MPKCGNVLRGALLATAIGMLAGCSEYMQRRDAITLNAGDAVLTNRVTQMVDPWPRESANRDIAFNGERMQSAVKRYRTNTVTNPISMSTGTTYQAPQQAAPAAANNTPVGPTVTGAPVK